MRTSNSGIFAVDQKTTTLIREVPKVELHLHLEGSMPIPLIKRLAARYQLTLDLEFAKDDTRIMWRDFADFLLKYDEASRVICCKEALEEITYEYLKCCHEQGCIYNELTVSPDHLARYGMSYDTVLSSVEAGIAKAKAEFDIDANIIIVIVRHGDNPDFSDLPNSWLRSQEQATKLINNVLRHSYQHVVGIGLAGAEEAFPPELFIEHFKRAREAGLKVTAHAGEWNNDVMTAIDVLGVTRIGHGIHLAFDLEKLKAAKEKGVHFELCPTSNEVLDTRKNYPDKSVNPYKVMDELDVSYSLSSDDPPLIGNNILMEYEYAFKHLGKDVAGLLKITIEAIHASFASSTLKAKLLEKVAAFADTNHITLSQYGCKY